jgi:predicted outer membrane protein
MVAHKFAELIAVLQAEKNRRKAEKSAGKPKRQPPMSKKMVEEHKRLVGTLEAGSKKEATPAAKKALAKEAQTQKAELKKVPQLKKAGKKETDM